MTASHAKSKTPTRLRASTTKVSKAAAKISQTAKRTAKRATDATKKAVSRAKQSAKQSSQKRKANRSKRNPFTWREGTLLSMICVCALMIGISLFVGKFYNPETYASSELERLAKSYYIEYLYPQMLGKNIDNPEKVLAKYADSGVANVSLRQFLLYNDGKHYSSLSIFQNSSYQCSLNKTFVRYYPVAPYGPRDFRTQYYPACETVE